MKIAIAVQGRFHAFDLARALRTRGHDVTVFTNYPKWAVRRFRLADDCVRSFPLHGVLARIGDKAREFIPGLEPERFLSPMFGRWLARGLSGEAWDAIHVWSGIAEEALVSTAGGGAVRILMRGSAEIEEQARILEEEERRTGRRLHRPGPWIRAREAREYALSDRILVLSSFARRSFLEAGVSADRVRTLLLGTDTAAFRPSEQVVEARCARILSGEPLRVLYTGNISLQKGFGDLAEAAQRLKGRNVKFEVVGTLLPEVRKLAAVLPASVSLVPRQPQNRLPERYAANDIFLFPTLQDGFPVVLAQAMANGLPVMATPNSSAPDTVVEGRNGWIIPVRRPEAIVERLLWCDVHRVELAAMVRSAFTLFRPRDWAEVAADFERICEAEMAPEAAQAVSRGR